MKTLVGCAGCGQILRAVREYHSDNVAPGHVIILVDVHLCPRTIPTS